MNPSQQALGRQCPINHNRGCMEKTLCVKDFGVIPDGTDCTAGLEKVAAFCRGKKDITLVFPEGRYAISGEHAAENNLYISNHDPLIGRRVALNFVDCRNLRLRAEGACLVAHGHVVPLLFEKCDDVVVEGLSIDWQRPLHAWAEVLGGWEAAITLKIDDQFPWRIERERLYFQVGNQWEEHFGCFGIDRALMRPADRSGDNLGTCWGVPWRARPGERGRVVLEGHIAAMPPVGDLVILRHGARYSPGLVASEVNNIALTNVSVHHAGGMAILMQRCANPTLTNVQVTASHGRPISACHDATHFMACRGLVRLENCRLERQLDDCTNIHGIYQPITAVTGKSSAVVRYVHDQQRGNIPGATGDTMTIIDGDSFLPLGEVAIKAVRYISAEFSEIEFTTPCPAELRPGNLLENADWKPDVHISNCTMGHNRARGILLAAGKKTVIEQNTFQSPGPAIRIHGDANLWYESGAMDEVVIRHNHFDHCGYNHFPRWGKAVILIDPQMTKVVAPYHQKITIEENTFTNCELPAVNARAVGQLTIRNNKGIGQVRHVDCQQVITE